METTQYPRMHVICKFKCSSVQQNRNLKIYGKEKERAREREETITKLATNSFIFNKRQKHAHAQNYTSTEQSEKKGKC